MTFEEFKIHFEKFSSIDSAEKLAICKQQYQHHLQHLEDLNFFEPTDYNEGSDKFSSYMLATEKILIPDSGQQLLYAFIVRPSFEPEFSLCLHPLNDEYTLTYTLLEKNFWGVMNDDLNLSKKIKRSTQTDQLNSAAGEKLVLLFEKIFREARPKQTGSFTLDGTSYNICKFTTDEVLRVNKQSPPVSSRSGRIINTLVSLIETFSGRPLLIQPFCNELDELIAG